MPLHVRKLSFHYTNQLPFSRALVEMHPLAPLSPPQQLFGCHHCPPQPCAATQPVLRFPSRTRVGPAPAQLEPLFRVLRPPAGEPHVRIPRGFRPL